MYTTDILHVAIVSCTHVQHVSTTQTSAHTISCGHFDSTHVGSATALLHGFGNSCTGATKQTADVLNYGLLWTL